MFHDRTEAARYLAKKLEAFANRQDVIVLGLTQGGANLGRAVADTLRTPFDILVTCKIATLSQPSLTIGTIIEKDFRIIDKKKAESTNASPTELEHAMLAAQAAFEQRVACYRERRERVALDGRTVILVDDGLITGRTMSAAIRAVRLSDIARIVVAIPLAPPAVFQKIQAEADQVVCLETHEPFYSLSTWYRNFQPVSENDVLAALDGLPAFEGTPRGSLQPPWEVAST